MGLFNVAGAALGVKTKNNNSTSNAGLSSLIGMGGAAGAIGGAIGGNSSKPIATDHTHDSDSKNQARTDALTARNNFGPRGGDGIMDAEERNDTFMGTNKDISAMEFGEMSRGGKMVENSPVQTAGAFPPFGTPDFTPREEFDQYGQQFIS